MSAGRNRSDKSRRLAASTLLMILGILVALAGIAIDYILPNASPGLNLPQLLVVVFGLALSLGGYCLRRAKHIPGRLRSRHIATVAVMSLLTLLTIEIALTVMGLPTYHPVEVKPVEFQPANWWVCDGSGCRYQYEAALAACAAGEISGRNCLVNRQGYSDSDDFVLRDDLAARPRILALGDSFTQGFSADIGQSYFEVLEQALPDAIIWNTAITGNGTQESLAAFESLAPTLQPQLTVLGFYMNDFLDNLLPVGSGWLMGRTPNGGLVARRYRAVDRWSNSYFTRFDPGMLLAFSSPPVNELEWAIGKTRLGSLMLKALDRMAMVMFTSPHPHQIEATRQHLRQLRDAARSLDSKLLALVIPYPSDLNAPGDKVQATLRLMNELDIPYLNLLDVLSPAMYHDPSVDPHWNNAGHAKVGALLTDCAGSFFASGDFEDCQHVVVP